MKCNNHGSVEAKGICIYCSLPFCRDCLIEIDHRYFCREHAKSQITIGKKNVSYSYENSKKSWLVALLLSIFLGHFGLHRFYLGRYITGILWLITVGVFGVGIFVDIILIATKNLTPVN